MFPESLLHYIWKFRLFDHQQLQTVESEPIEILQAGLHNRHAGPDFSEARIRIADTLWVGQVEIHLSSSDWIKHGHSSDGAYDNVVLHVVYEHDVEIYRKDGSRIPTLVLKSRISEEIIGRSLALLNSPEQIPCATHFKEVPELTVQMWLERLVVERLEMKTEAIRQELEKNTNNWESAFYVFLAKNFGTPVNAGPFEFLARSLPLAVLAKHKDSLFQLEALLFGQAGFLEEDDFEEEYPKKLKAEYAFLSRKFELRTINVSVWKFGRMRPAAFPTIRLALFAQLVHQSNHLFSKLLETEDLPDFKAHFNLKVSDYWLAHYRIGDDTQKRQQKSLGESTFHNIVINTLVPFLFVYGKIMQREELCDRALRWLEGIAAEDNGVIKMWEELGLKIENAHQSQALLQLKKHYCDQKHCLDCAIGNKILRY